MTRKCALCKATNYKRTYSFFSAPKDPEVRKKWQEVIPIPNYIVTDETFVCSKHFKSSDIITHWVSGVPPHVITIKYKKCRLRVGAVPCLNFGDTDETSEINRIDEVNSHNELLDNQIDFLIPRERPAEYISLNPRVEKPDFNHTTERDEPLNKYGKYVVVHQDNALFTETEFLNDNSSYKTYIVKNGQIQESVILVENAECNEPRNHFDQKYPGISNVQNHVEINNEALHKNENSKHNEAVLDSKIDSDSYQSETLLTENVKLEQNVGVFDELIIQEDVTETLQAEKSTDNDEESQNDFAGNKDETIMREDLGDNILEELEVKSENTCGQKDIDSELCDTMLFEDLLEIYTEVTLPRGWAYLVTSKGHATTVVYLCMTMPTNHIPVVEKKVYVKSDMVMHCGVGNKEINPFLHNLVKDGKNNRVRALSDIEELIDELDQRHICEGGPNIQNYGEIENQIAYADGMKWRHVGCPVIINNDSSRCSKCVSLNTIIVEGRNRNVGGPSCDPLGKKQLKIETLRRSIRNITRRNQRLEKMKLRFRHLLLVNSKKTINNKISSFNMPEIQKLLIKECLTTSMSANKINVRFSETWIFLCLQLYVKSPRMYRYMLVNKYMTLPPMGTIRRYFNQIKTDPQFYNSFQRSVEPFQPVNEQDKEES